MNVRELINELGKIPDDYEVQVTLSELAGPDATKEEEIRCMESVVAGSAFIFSANAYDKEKMAFILGCALPKPENPRFDLYGSHLTPFQRDQIQAWMEETYEDGVRHPLSNEDADIALLIADDKIRYDSEKNAFLQKGYTRVRSFGRETQRE